MDEWKKVKLKELLKQNKESFFVEDDKIYLQIKITNKGEIKLRGKKRGEEIGTKKQTFAEEGMFIYSRLGIHEGSFGLIPKELDGAIVTGDMPIFYINENQVSPFFLLYSINNKKFMQRLVDLTRGLAQTRVREKYFLDLEIPLPSKKEQEQIVKKLSLFSEKHSKIDSFQAKNLLLVQKLRQKILQEAVQGKLVQQNPNDEPASELLKKIKKEKEKQIKKGKIKKQKSLPPISEDEIPYDLPKGWIWARLGSLVDLNDNSLRRGPFGSAIRKDIFVPKSKNTYKVYEQGNAIYKNTIKGDYFINQDDFNRLKRFECGSGDIIISCSGTIGEAYLLLEDAPKGVINQALLKIKLNNKIISNEYFLHLFKSLIQKQINDSSKGSAMKNLVSLDYLKKRVLFPLPPFPEQKRIVEKVDNLMAVCDELEKRIKANQRNSERLMQAVLKESFGNGK